MFDGAFFWIAVDVDRIFSGVDSSFETLDCEDINGESFELEVGFSTFNSSDDRSEDIFTCLMREEGSFISGLVINVDVIFFVEICFCFGFDFGLLLGFGFDFTFVWFSSSFVVELDTTVSTKGLIIGEDEKVGAPGDKVLALFLFIASSCAIFGIFLDVSTVFFGCELF